MIATCEGDISGEFSSDDGGLRVMLVRMEKTGTAALALMGGDSVGLNGCALNVRSRMVKRIEAFANGQQRPSFGRNTGWAMSVMIEDVDTGDGPRVRAATSAVWIQQHSTVQMPLFVTKHVQPH